MSSHHTRAPCTTLPMAAYTTKPHISTLLLLSTLILTLLIPSTTAIKMTSEPSAISNLVVDLTQTGFGNPHALTATVTNNNDYAVSVLSYDSPLDSAAMALGLVSLSVSSDDMKAQAVEWPTIKMSRVWPPALEDLITIHPGRSVSKEILLQEPFVKVEDLAGKEVKAKIEGEWRAVWRKEKDGISAQSLDDPKGEAEQGPFASESLQLKID